MGGASNEGGGKSSKFPAPFDGIAALGISRSPKSSSYLYHPKPCHKWTLILKYLDFRTGKDHYEGHIGFSSLS